METNTNNETGLNEMTNELDPAIQLPGSEDTVAAPDNKKKKYHSSALYAARMWHSSVGHVKPPHAGGGIINMPLQS